MNEAARNMTGFEDETARNPALGNAIRRAAQGIGGSENLTPESIKDLFRSRGIIGESQEKLGEEVGAIAGDEIVKNGGIINLMSSEKPLQNSVEGTLETRVGDTDAKSLREEIVGLDLKRSKIMNDTRHREPTEEERVALRNITDRMVTVKDSLSSLPPEEQTVTVSDTEIESDATRKTEAPAVAESVVFVHEKTAVATETPGQQPLAEDFSPATALEQTKKEIDALKQKKEEILKNIRDHTTITDHVKEAIEVNKQIEELENTLRNPVRLNQQEIDNAQDVETPSVEAHLNTGVDTTTPDSAIHIKATGEIVPNPFEKSITRIKAEDPARAERLLKTIGASPEQKERIEKLLGATETQAQKIEQETKEKDHWVVERALKIGEWYRRLPLKYKLIASSVLMSSAGVAAAVGGAGIGMIMGAAFVGSTGQRFLGSLAMFVTVEGILTKQSLACNEEEKKILGVRMNVILGALAGSGVFLGGKLLGDYLSSGGEHAAEVAPPPSPQVPVVPAPEALNLNAKEIFDSVQEKIKAAIPLPHEEMAVMNNSMMTPGNELFGHAAAAETASSIMTPENEIIGHAADKVVETSYAVQGGDNLWKIIEEKIPGIKDLDGEGRQSNAIANIIEQIKKDPESFGISSGNVDNLTAGDVLNMEKIHSVLENTKISAGGVETTILERAEGLSGTEISTIEANNEKLAEWQAEHPGEQLTTETTEKILGEPSPTETPSENFDNVRKDMETVEAISMKTEQIFRADIQNMFGSKGFFGYGFLGTNGEKSIDWLDLKGRTVDEILSKKFVGVPTGEEGAVQKFGIDSFSAVDKMREYIYMLVEKAGAGTIPEPNESVEHFLKRAINAIVSKK